MKRKIAAMMIALPLGTLFLLPKSAPAVEVNPQFNIHRSPVIVAQRRPDYRRRNPHRIWVPGRWESRPYGRRRWIPGHWVYRR